MMQPILWAAFLFLALYFSGYLAFLSPLPLVYLSLRKSKRAWWWAVAGILSAMLPLFFYLPNLRFFAAGVFFCYLLLAFVLSLGLWRRWKLFSAGLVAALTAVGFVLLFGFVCRHFGWFDGLALLKNAMRESLTLMENMIQSPGYKGDRTQALLAMAQVKVWSEFLPWLFPSLLFGLTACVVAVNLAGLFLMRRTFSPNRGEVAFQNLEAPISFVWVLVAAGFLYFGEVYFHPNLWLKALALNLLIMALLVYFFQGLSIIAFFLKRYSFLFRFGIYGLLVLFFQLLAVLVAGLGVADTWFDFRKLRR